MTMGSPLDFQINVDAMVIADSGSDPRATITAVYMAKKEEVVKDNLFVTKLAGPKKA